MLDKIADYLLEKETITGQEMMCIMEGKDPALADNFGATAEKPDKAALQGDIEPPARSVHMVSQPVEPPPPWEEEPAGETPTQDEQPDE